MTSDKEIGQKLISLSNLLRRVPLDGLTTVGKTNTMIDERPTAMQHWILKFIFQNSDRDVFQRDLEAAFRVRRSTATGLLQLLEKNGYIKKEPVDYDARLKKLILTSKALKLREENFNKIETTEVLLTKGLTVDEIKTLSLLLDKIKNNLE